MTRAAEDAATEKLKTIWKNVLGLDSVEIDQNYFDLGGDSSLAVQMFIQIEQVFHVKLPLVTLYEAQTIEELERLLTADAPPVGWSPLVAIQPAGTRPPIYCFHGAGGNVLSYRKLSLHLGPDQPFYGLQCQGLDGTSPLLATIEEMAALYVKHIRGVQPRGPYLLGGYCMGGTVAYEVAQQFRASGEQVALLALFDTMNWHRIPLNIWSRSSHAIQRLAFHTASFFNLDARDMSQFFTEKIEVLRSRVPVWLGRAASRFRSTRGEASASDFVLLAKIWKTNDHASWTYVPKSYAGTLTDFRPFKQYRVFKKPDLKWDRLAGEQKVIVLPVYPAGMLVEPFVRQLAASLTKSIDEVLLPVTARRA